MTRTEARLVGLLLIGIAASACSAGDAKTLPAEGHGPIAATQNQILETPRDHVKDGGTFTWAIDSVPPNFNYHQPDGTELSNSQVIGALMPVTFDNDAVGTPVWNRDLLASNPVVVTEPRQLVTYEINPKAAWYDGTPI